MLLLPVIRLQDIAGAMALYSSHLEMRMVHPCNDVPSK